MKVEVNQKEENVKPFPKLMIHADGDIYLFQKECVGTIVFTRRKILELGSQCKIVYMEGFKDLEGSITLSND